MTILKRVNPKIKQKFQSMIPYFTFTQIQLGTITIQVWGLMVSLGFLFALFLSLREIKKQNIQNLSRENIWDIMIIALAGMVVGGRALYVVFNFGEFENLAEIFYLQNGGLSLIGGVAISAIVICAYAKIKKIDIWKLADVLIQGAIAAVIFARIGCFLIYDHIGKITNLPWGRLYIDETIRHPVILYHIISCIIILLIIRYFKSKRLKKGALFLVGVFCYLVFRFSLDFLRCSDLAICDSRYLNLTYTQWILLAATPFVIYLLFKKTIYKKRSVAS